MTASLLEARGLVAGHGARRLFPSFDLTLHAGELVCLLGGNGAGKTTLLKTLAGIHAALAGEVFLQGESLSALPSRERARRAALLLADVAPPAFLTGREYVRLGRTPHAPAPGDAERLESLMARLRCAHLADRRLGTLSDGERQRLSLARALAQDAPVLLLDEPLSHLDPPAKAELLQLLRDWTRGRDADGESGTSRAVIAAVHEVDLALGFADRCLLVAPGQPPFCGAPEDAAGEPLRRAFPGWPDYWDALAIRKGMGRNADSR